ncbi:MAG: ribonuclease J [Candidatus Nomurabacteria bacterium]|jgi:ribonuclease J|nr:ribonuclease J [Candidatus Nomurabacteria bacterium]
MGQQRLKTVKKDDVSKRPNARKTTGNTVLDKTDTRMGEVIRASRRKSEDVNLRASQHIIDIPVNKSVYNGYDGEQYSPARDKHKKPSRQPRLRVIPVGGCGEMGIGKNMTAFEYDNEIIVVDMGFIFPGAEDYPGINYITPDISYLEQNRQKIKAVIFTHAHLDHIGAFRHLIAKIPAPVYATKFTIGMLRKNMEESPDKYEPKYIEMNPEKHDRMQLSDSFSVEFVRVNHSIPDSAALIIRTPVGTIFHSGDWRFEKQPVDEKIFDMARISEVANREGFVLMLNESTNVESEGTHTHSEFDIKNSFGEVMEKFPNSRMIVSTFSSQVHRIQTLLDQAAAHGRKVAFAGYSMLQNVEVALKSGMIKIPKNTIMKMDEIIKQPDSKVCIVCTGSQGEFNAVLSRMASGAHKYIKIKDSDIIVFSSNPIPGNEIAVTRIVDGLMREGSDVLQNRKTAQYGVGPLHLSGHAYFDDHVALITAVNPKYYVPIHGEFHMLANNAELAEKSCGINRKNIFVCDAGDVLELYHDGSAKKAGRIDVGGIMYDDSGAVVSEVVLRDRIHMSTDGIFVVVVTVSRGNGRLLGSPDIISRGFIYLRDSEELMGLVRQYLRQKVATGYGAGRKSDVEKLKNEIRDEVAQILYDQTQRTPIVIPVINEIGGNNTRSTSNADVKPRGNTRQPVISPALQQNFTKKSPAPRPSARAKNPAPRRAAASNPGAISFKKRPTGPAAGSLWR